MKKGSSCGIPFVLLGLALPSDSNTARAILVQTMKQILQQNCIP